MSNTPDNLPDLSKEAVSADYTELCKKLVLYKRIVHVRWLAHVSTPGLGGRGGELASC
jgi:hypothetical protein